MKKFDAFIKTLVQAMILYVAVLGLYFSADFVFDFPCAPIKGWYELLDVANLLLIIISLCVSAYFNMKGGQK